MLSRFHRRVSAAAAAACSGDRSGCHDRDRAPGRDRRRHLDRLDRARLDQPADHRIRHVGDRRQFAHQPLPILDPLERLLALRRQPRRHRPVARYSTIVRAPSSAEADASAIRSTAAGGAR
jgi:hypothetical protein